MPTKLAPRVVIRRAADVDIDALAALAATTYTSAFGHSMSPADLAAHLDRHLAPARIARMMQDDVFLVGHVAERMVGFVQFGPVASVDGDRELRRLYVHDDFQGQGIGGELLEAALAHPHMQRAPNVILDVWEFNHGAQRFYRRYGFEVVGARPFEVASDEPTSLDLVMVRRQPV